VPRDTQSIEQCFDSLTCFTTHLFIRHRVKRLLEEISKLRDVLVQLEPFPQYQKAAAKRPTAAHSPRAMTGRPIRDACGD
jgi:hypothetical protein